MRVLITRPIPEAGTRLLAEAGLEIDLREESEAPSRDELLRLVPGAHGLITLLSDRVDEELLEAAGRQLRVVANYAVGVDNIDLEACARRGVAVANTPDVLTEATADQAMALLLAVARRLREGHDLVAGGGWEGWHPLQLLGFDLSGATLGIVGMGRIGRAVARRALAFSMRVVYHNRRPDQEAERELGATYVSDLLAMLRESDVVSLHAPLTDETRHLIGARELAAMRRPAILVNTARGALVDEAALAEALQRGQLWGAGLDVFEEEPRVHPGLLGLPNVVLAPHLGSATLRTRSAMAELCARAVVEVLAGGKPANLVRGRGDAPR